MGNLINPLSRILGFKKNLFWGNNFAFYYLQDVYRQKIFKIKCLKKIFKYIFRYMFRLFDIPRVHYSLKINFVGQANSILHLECQVRNLNLYNMAILLLALDNDKVGDVSPKYRHRFGIFSLRSRLQHAIKFLKARFERVFVKWRSILVDLFIQKLDKKSHIKKYKLVDAVGNMRKKYGKIRHVIGFCQHFFFDTDKTKYLKNKYNLDTLKQFFQSKFKLIGMHLLLLRSMCNKFFVENFSVLFRSFFLETSFKFGLKNIKLNFKRKKSTASAILRNVNHFCYLALRRGYRINYVIKVVRYSVRFLKIVRGFQMIVSGRFYRRGRAMFKISTLGEIGSQSGKGSLMYRNSERVKEYGMCSIKLLFFFRRQLKILPKIPLRCKWYHYLKYLRSNYKIRSQFGYIRY